MLTHPGILSVSEAPHPTQLIYTSSSEDSSLSSGAVKFSLYTPVLQKCKELIVQGQQIDIAELQVKKKHVFSTIVLM